MRDERVKRVALFLTALLLLALPCLAQTAKTYRVPFHTVNAIILLDAKVNGKTAVLILDTGAQDSMVDSKSVGFDPRQSKLHSTGVAGAEGTCVVREVELALEHYRWLNRKVCVIDLSDASKRLGTHIDGLIGQDVLREFSAVKIDYRAGVVEFETK